MYHLKKAIIKIRTQFPETTVAQILIQWGRWLLRRKRILALILLGGTVLKLALVRPIMVTLQGETMCMPYRIQYLDRWGRNFQQEVEALLVHLHQFLSTASPDSELSRFNEHDCSDFYFDSSFFYPLFDKSKEIYRNTAGAFDPTILPLVNAWEDFAANADADSSSPSVDRLCEYVSLDYVVANERRIKKLKAGVKLDFSSILKGYAADQIADLLRTHGIEHMWIVLGGKAMAHGQPGSHQAWYMAIHPHVAPFLDAKLQINIELMNKAVAISNKKGKEWLGQSCIIDPSTGYPPQHTLLAAVVLSKECSTADAYATAMMVRGLAFAKELLEQQEELAAFLIYEDDHGAPAFYTSSSLRIHQKDHTITLQLAQEPS